jgi:N6-adenosine-specific RNA methylase IME4
MNSDSVGTEGKYRLAYLDPPWRFKNFSMAELAKRGEKWARRNGRSPYPVMTTEDIGKLPVPEMMTSHSALVMWATSPKMEDAFWLINHWGYEFKTILFTWVKLNPSGAGWHFGLGYHSRQNAEYVLYASRGQGVKRVNNKVFSLVVYPRGEHSAKPPAVMDRLERLYGDIPRVELFARTTRPGWDYWGNEVECSPGASLLEPFLAPPYKAIVDEDEYDGMPVIDAVAACEPGEQMLLC